MYIYSVICTKIYTGDIMKFKIKKQEYITKTFRFPADLLDQLIELSVHKDISLNQLIVQCCEFAIENLDEEDNISEK